ncbi:MAG: hypothetical protein L0216_06555 [Planctomycetales bacterium]|nr:hypothetical protein [Planctomycetales bacterium]
MLRTKFVPVALDQWYQRRQKDAEGEFYRKIAGQGPRNDFKGTTQGLYAAAPDGTFLGYNNNRGPERVRKLLRKALDAFRPADAPPIEAGPADPQYAHVPPEGGLVVDVTAKVLGGYPEPKDWHERIFQVALQRDHLWVRKDEHEALARGKIPESLRVRIARFHLVDGTRGEPPMWKREEIRRLDLALAEGRLSGSVHLETESGDRGFEADLLGFVEAKDGRVTRLDLVAKGLFWGEGRYTKGAPPGKFPLAVRFALASGKDAADRIPPEGGRGWHADYIR